MAVQALAAEPAQLFRGIGCSEGWTWCAELGLEELSPDHPDCKVSMWGWRWKVYLGLSLLQLSPCPLHQCSLGRGAAPSGRVGMCQAVMWGPSVPLRQWWHLHLHTAIHPRGKINMSWLMIHHTLCLSFLPLVFSPPVSSCHHLLCFSL